jgi:hypothetical protein
MAHTLVYETKILGDGSLPTELAAPVETPTRVIAGGESFPYTRETALAQIIPDARARVLEGQTHDIAQHALASVLNDVFAAARWDRQVPSAWTGGSRHFAPKCFREVAASLKPA